jgi:HK97 family phage prohead protease
MTVCASQDDRPDAPSMIVTSPTLDRQGDRVLLSGLDLRPFLKNPALLWAHNYHEIPIGSVTRLTRDGDRALHAQWKWLDGDAFTDRVKNAWSQGVIRASSIGFRPLQVVANEVGGYDIPASELLEVSLCPIGANPDATRVFKSLGLLDVVSDSSCIKTHVEREEPTFVFRLDEDEQLVIDRDPLGLSRDRLQRRFGAQLKRSLAQPPEPTYRISSEDLKAVCTTFADHYVKTLNAVVATEVRSAINHARGRVD